MIILKNLGFHYRQGRPVLEEISAELAPGKVYALLGLNGVGKTTFLKIMAGLRFPSYGSVEVNGFAPRQRTVGFLSDMIFVPDEVVLPNVTVGQFAKLYGRLYSGFDAGKFADLLSDFRVDIGVGISSLSFGQRKKMYLAFVMAAQTRVLLLDEPTNGLDIPSKAQFRKALSKHISPETTVIISTHQVRDLHSVVDHLLVLDKGRLVVNSSVSGLALRIAFTSSPTDHHQVLYSEVLLNRNQYMVTNLSGDEGDFEIEPFFNAIANRPEILNHIPDIN